MANKIILVKGGAVIAVGGSYRHMRYVVLGHYECWHNEVTGRGLGGALLLCIRVNSAGSYNLKDCNFLVLP